MTVAAVTPRTPAAVAGLVPGDRILAVNGHRLRDAILVLGALQTYMTGGRIRPRPTWAGKAAT